MKTVFHKAGTRGHADHGWLQSYHSFSFAGYHNSDRMHFGVLRVLNDDTVAPGKGFGTHPHDNMEIISISLEGDLEHKDSMGNRAIIKEGDIQVMSAGTGIYHSEYNKNADQPVKFLQIWMFPKRRNVEPRYDQIKISSIPHKGKMIEVVSPDPNGAGVWVHQDSWFHIGNFENGDIEKYTIKRDGNGVYIFVLEGTIHINGQSIEARDGMGIWDTDEIEMTSDGNSRILLMDIPMKLPVNA